MSYFCSFADSVAELSVDLQPNAANAHNDNANIFFIVNDVMFAKNKLRRYENGTCWIVLDFFAFFCKQFARFFTKFFAGEATYLFCNKIPKKMICILYKRIV